jgi:tetratricopeptide (TPR) repeat protein
LAFFQKTGDLRMVSQSLRFQGDLQENLGQPDAARAAYQKALAASPAPADQLQSRQRLAFLARQLGRYEEAAVQFTDIIAAAEESGERVTAQTYRLELAAVLTATGRFPDAARQIAVVRAQSPANGQMAYKLDVEQTSLDFQQLRFEAAIARLSSLLAAAKKEGEPSREQSMRYQLCAYTAEAAQSRQALALCTPLKKEFRDRPLQLITVTASLALAHLDRGATALAVREAEDAVRLSEQAANPREIWYSLLVLCQAQHKARLGAWMQTRARAHAAMETLGASIGRDALRQYVSRPIIARRRQTVDLLQ